MSAPTTAPVPTSNIQGDILFANPKKAENFTFFAIEDVAAFQKRLKLFIPKISHSGTVSEFRARIRASKEDAKARGEDAPLLEAQFTNIAFSRTGLRKLGVNPADLGDSHFSKGMAADARDLGDKIGNDGKPLWDATFLQPIDGVVINSAQGTTAADLLTAAVITLFTGTIKVIDTIKGKVREPNDKLEHFGFVDGISQPAVRGVNDSPFPGQPVCDLGVMVLGGKGDKTFRKDLVHAQDGSFLVFRKLNQLVPEFDDWLNQAALSTLGMTPEFLGARLLGRWKSGAPIDVAFDKDDPVLAKDELRNNDFQYTFKEPKDDQINQFRCPFSAHIRKTNPRADLGGQEALEENRITRRGIAFGKEVSLDEKKANKTAEERGLLFVCYQSNIDNGFFTLQRHWANAPDFPPGKPTGGVPIGLDPIVGRISNKTERQASGLDPNSQPKTFTMPDFVVSHGGEYFFAPSISVLKSLSGGS